MGRRAMLRLVCMYMTCVFLHFSVNDTLSNRESTQVLTSVQMIELKGSWSGWGRDCIWISDYLHEPCMTIGCRYYQGYYIDVIKYDIVRCEEDFWATEDCFYAGYHNFCVVKYYRYAGCVTLVKTVQYNEPMCYETE